MKNSFLKSITNTKMLIEGIEEVKKYYPLFKPHMFEILAKLDPTYKGGNELGTYTKWIYNLYNNYLKDLVALEKWQEQKQQGKDYPKPEKKFQEQIEDFNKIPDLLKKFDAIKKKANLNINNIKTIADLYSDVTNALKSENISEKSEVQHALDLVKESVSKGAQIIYRTNKWIILIPKTFESSKVFGEDTNWCTTASNGYYYEKYMREYGGEYLINVDLSTGDLYQFHFESEQFMDSSDRRIDMDDFTTEYPEVATFLKEYKDKEYSRPIDELVEEKMNDEKWMRNYFDIEHYEYTDEGITGQMDISALPDSGDYQIYNAGRHGISLNSLEKLLSGEAFWDYDSGYPSFTEISRYSIRKKYFDKEMEGYGISWEDIEKAYEYGTEGSIDSDYDKLSFEQLEKIYNLLSEDYYDDRNIFQVYDDCQRNGAESEAFNSIISDLKDELPLNDEGPYLDEKLQIKLPTKSIKSVLKYLLSNGYRNDNDLKPWYEHYSREDSEFLADAPWIYVWRCDKFSNEEFAIAEPYYGWDGFDEDMWDDAFDNFIKNVKEVIRNDNKDINEGYVRKKSEFGNTGVFFDDEYIEFEPGMAFIDNKDRKWVIEKVINGTCIVRNEEGKMARIEEDSLNTEIFALDKFHMVYDPKFFSPDDGLK